MKKIIPILVIVVLVLSGLGAGAISKDVSYDAKNEEKTDVSSISFPPLIIEEHDEDYFEVSLTDVSTYLMSPGKPMLPKIVKNVELAFGVRNVKVNVIPKTVKEYKITKEVRPAPVSVPLTEEIFNAVVKPKKNAEVYTSQELFPSAWYRYNIGCGLNAANERITYLTIHIYPVRYIPSEGKLHIAESADITITYEEPRSNPFPENSLYDLVIIAPNKFSGILKKLVDHKISYGINTTIKTTEEIYNSGYNGIDKPEQIKYFIKEALETWNVKYVLLVGGLKSLIWGRPRDDYNQGTKDWHVPVRYTNLFDNPEHPLSSSTIFDPGVISDLYYADIYEAEGNFSSWDPNGDHIFAAWGRPGVENDTGLDLYPDVCLGRLACRNRREVKIMVNKIIKYESTPADPSWFKKMIVVSGDGFLDQEDLDFQWNVTDLPDGEYTIYAQSKNPEDDYGPIDVINVTLDQSTESNISFNHDDHLTTGLNYPFDPIAEITSPSEGDILGYTDFFYEPPDGKAYCNDFTGWANVSYESGIMHIRGKSYDPQPYGNVTDIHVWIGNSDEQIVFSQWRNDTKMYYEGEWVTGEKMLKGKGGALYYMPSDFNNEILWTSNGKLNGQEEVIDALSEGSGFAFFSGHGSPRVWADHYPGVPGNRGPASVTGLVTTDPFGGPPFLPVERILNIGKPFVLVVGGCHNSQFNVSLITSIIDMWRPLYMWTYGMPAPECWSWWLTRLPRRGAIASIGNTGLGYGTLGEDCTINGLDGGLSRDFFRQYGEEGHQILGETHSQTLTNYIGTFDMEEDDHVKTVQQWVLLGDPSLMIGGY
ncbi:MAG: peptidase C25 [Thermoplasmatales archaeon]|nr:MAG: peptidase C25 [Thermoplasmatales archaeon]